jgi:transcriptional regulator with XRE-family HTH domain
MSTDKSMSPEQCKAARALLRWDQGQLAAAAKVSRATIANFETGKANLMANNLRAMQQALEEAGIEFIQPNGGGPGVRLKRPQ